MAANAPHIETEAPSTPGQLLRASLPATPTSLTEIVAALRTITPLEGLTDEEYAWIATNGTERMGENGTLLFEQTEPAVHLNFILRGEVHVRRRGGGPVSFFIGRAGQMTGKLPFSRMKFYGGDGYSVGPIWGIDIHESRFPDMLAAIPSMGQRCVSVLLDRVREITRMEQQAEKLSALGKLAANLAHELNNPASAAQRSAASLFTELGDYGSHKYRLGALNLAPEQSAAYVEWVRRTRAQIAAYPEHPDLSPLHATDREDEILRWLQSHNVPDAWKIAPSLAETTLSLPHLEELAAFSSPEVLPLAAAAFSSALRVERMAETVLNATVRIFDLISAIKDYSYMDQAPIQEIDLRQSLERTLAMFNSRLGGIDLQVDFDSSIPPIRAYGSELNQVWTALIENALDAIDRNPTEGERGTLRITTRLSGSFALVEIIDSGPGISPELQSRIFEPFYTTKAPGKGLGLGLDVAQRIVQKHSGFLTVDTTGPQTCFQVRLPLDQAEAY